MLKDNKVVTGKLDELCLFLIESLLRLCKGLFHIMQKEQLWILLFLWFMVKTGRGRIYLGNPAPYIEPSDFVRTSQVAEAPSTLHSTKSP